jgi:hypothetical protein
MLKRGISDSPRGAHPPTERPASSDGGVRANNVFDMKNDMAEERRPVSVPRFNIREIGMSEAVAVYRKVTGAAPEPEIEEYIVDKYVQWEGDMARLENLVNTMWSIAQAETEGTDYAANDYMYIVTKSIGGGYGAAESRQGVQDWVEYEAERAIGRPNANRVGPGESVLKRPWADAATQLINSKSYGRTELQSIDQLDPDGNPEPGAVGAADVTARADWMFE